MVRVIEVIALGMDKINLFINGQRSFIQIIMAALCLTIGIFLAISIAILLLVMILALVQVFKLPKELLYQERYEIGKMILVTVISVFTSYIGIKMFLSIMVRHYL